MDSFLEEVNTPLLGPASSMPSSKILSETKVYPLIHLIRVDVLAHIDTPLTYEQLIAPDSTYTIIRPLTEKYLELQNQATVFCLLLNKVQFERDSAQLSIATLSLSRALLCEILAIRVLRGWSERSLPLATVLLTPWALFQGASNEVIERVKEEGEDDLLCEGGNALEMAIVSGSKRFIRSPSCQKVIEGIWSGKIIYSALNAHALIKDNYKRKPIQLYNPHKAPLLDHYRLKVPRVRSFLEYTNFLVLFILYVVAIQGLEDANLNWKEIIFIIYALAFSVDKLAAIREHGLKVFSSSLVNGFDLVFMVIYFVYLGARTYGFHYDDPEALSLGADLLAIGAVMIFPRLAFVTLANNLMVLSIRSMLTEFFFLMAIGTFSLLGFLYALFTLGQGRFELMQIGWWLLEIYFGLDASGFEAAHNFHPFLGPLLTVTYALLSNTLLLTVLVAILGNTFATINADAAAESMFRKAVSTLEGVKADAVFSYQLPFNLLALAFMWPLSFFMSPRYFHKLNVFMIRASNFPVLLAIALYERQKYREESLWEQFGDFIERYVGTIPRRIKAVAGLDNFGSRHDISLIFEIEREVGDFYAGWEEDGFDDSEIQLPPPFVDENESESEAESEEETTNGSATGKSPRKESDDGGLTLRITHTMPVTSSPRKMSFDGSKDPATSQRSRRKSLPSSPGDPIKPFVNSPIMRRRRNTSMHDPSPLARLFLRNSLDSTHETEPNPLRERRNSLVEALRGPTASTPVPSALNPLRRRGHSRSESQPTTLDLHGRSHLSQSVKRSFSPIPERRLEDSVESLDNMAAAEASSSAPPPTAGAGAAGRVHFPATQTRPKLTAEDIISPKNATFPMRSPSGAYTPTREVDDPVGKASDVAEALAAHDQRMSGVGERLERMEKRQKRIEELLEKLVGGDPPERTPRR